MNVSVPPQTSPLSCHPMLNRSFPPFLALALVALIGLIACDNGTPQASQSDTPTEDEIICECTVPSGNCENAFTDSGVNRGGIPALNNPALTEAENAHLDQGGYLADSSRVIGLVVNGQPLAVPHNILWHHEITNLTVNGKEIAVTYCPLTGSALAFDRSPVDGANFAVSGLLFKNNLVMVEETSDESLWPQMNRAASCGPKTGISLSQLPVVDTKWSRWSELYPGTQIISGDTGFDFNYTPSGNRYAGYSRPTNENLFVPMSIDERRPPKERVLGIPRRRGGIAYPFQALSTDAHRAIATALGEQSIVVFWNRSAQAAMAYEPILDGDSLSFKVRNGAIIDERTESTWTVAGTAVKGPLAGERLQPIEEAYTAFWFAWAAFQPNTRLWTTD